MRSLQIHEPTVEGVGKGGEGLELLGENAWLRRVRHVIFRGFAKRRPTAHLKANSPVAHFTVHGPGIFFISKSHIFKLLFPGFLSNKISKKKK